MLRSMILGKDYYLLIDVFIHDSNFDSKNFARINAPGLHSISFIRNFQHRCTLAKGNRPVDVCTNILMAIALKSP